MVQRECSVVEKWFSTSQFTHVPSACHECGGWSNSACYAEWMIERYEQVLMILAAIAVGLFAVSVWLDYHEHQVAVRSHNLNVFYKSLTCGDLPLGSDTNEAACEQAIGKFMLPEDGLFTR